MWSIKVRLYIKEDLIISDLIEVLAYTWNNMIDAVHAHTICRTSQFT